jgi:AcrR family transcriptional regulator
VNPHPPSRTSRRPPRAARKGEQTAERILDAAEALFAEHGFAGTTLRGVANVVGLRTPSLYNHFPSKESLYAAVLERGLRPVLETLVGIVGDYDPEAELSRQVSRLMEILSERPNLPLLVQHEVLTGGEHLSPLLREWIRPLLRRARDLVESSPAAPRWREDEIAHLVIALYNVVIGYFTLAPVYAELDGEDLLAPAALARQTRFLEHFVESLLLDRNAR